MILRRSENILSAWKCAVVLALGFLPGISNIYAQALRADFSTQSEACINEKLIISNNSTSGVTYSWDFCEGDLMSMVSAGTGAQLSGAFNPKDIDVVEADGALYGFVTSRSTNAIYRIRFPIEGNTLPIVTNLGNIGSLLSGPEQIKIVEEGGLWYGLVVNGANSSMIRLDFGNSLSNTPTAHNILNEISTVNSGMDVVLSNGEWFAAITNSATQKVTIVKFGNSIANDLQLADIVTTPSIPGMSAPDDVQLLSHKGSWYAFVIGFNSRTIHRLKFGPDLFAVPEMTVISGPAFTINQRPSGIRVHRDAGKYIMLVQTFDGSLFRLDLGADIENNSPAFANLGNFGVLGSSVNLELVKQSSTWYGFIINQSNLKVDRIFFEDVCPATRSISIEEVPVNIAYTQSGTYAVSLTIQDENRTADYISQLLTVTPLEAPQLEILSQNVCLSNVVHFQVQTPVEIVAYHWDFDDQSISSTDPAPDYQFSKPGSFEVVLEASANNGCRNSARKHLKIYEAPTSSFALPPLVCTNSEVVFTNNTPDIYEGHLMYEWYVDNNPVSFSRDLRYSFTNTVPKTIRLKTSIPGCENENTQVTPEAEVGPLVDFSFSGLQCEGDLFNFLHQVSEPVETYLWNFGDGHTSTDDNPSRQFPSFGSYSVSLTATNAKGCHSVKMKTIEVYAKPLIDFSVDGPLNTCAGSPTFFNNASQTPDGTAITRWLWTINDAANEVITDKESVEHLYLSPGTYPVSLTATTAAGCTATLEKDITILPSPSTTFTHTPACEDEPVLFTGPSDALIESSYWEIGTSYSYDASPTHTFAAPGDYPLYAEFYGSNGCISTIETTIRVPVPLTPDFSVIKNCVDHETIFTDITEGADAVATRIWNFPDETTATASPASHLFSQQGSQSVTLQVTTESGCAYSTTKQVEIVPKPIAAFTTTPETGAYPLDVMFSNTSLNADRFEWSFHDGTGNTSALESPPYTFSTLGTFDVTLTAYNLQECAHSFTRAVTTVAPLPDADIEMIQLLAQPDGSTKLIVTIHNKGNTILKNLPMLFDFAGDLSLTQTVPDAIMPGTQYNFVLNSAILNAENLGYLCVALDLENDLSPRGNRSCGALATNLLLLPAYPNPTSDDVQLEWISPQSKTTTVALIDRMGRTMLFQQITSTPGFNSQRITTRMLPAGIYLLVIDDGSTKRVQRIAVER